METRASHVLVGAFVLGILALAAAGAIWLGSAQFHRKYAYYDIYFHGSVAGLNTGAPVRYNGIQIGRVDSIQLAPQNVEEVLVRIETDPRVPIKQDAYASLEMQGITGYAFVQITGGTKDSPPLVAKPDQPHPVIASVPSRLEKVFQSAPELLERTIQLADRLSDLLSDRNRAAIDETLDNLRRASAALGGKNGEFSGVLVEGAATLKDLRATLASANRTLATANRTLASLNEQLAGKGGAAEKLTATLEDFDIAAKRLSDMTGRLDAMVKENRPAVRDFAQRGLSELNQLLAESRTLVASLTRVAAEIERDPPRFFFGDRREGYRPR